MKSIIILALCAALTSCASGKRLKGLCTQIESSNNLELCELGKATIVISNAGQHVIMNNSPEEKAKPSPSPAASPAKASK